MAATAQDTELVLKAARLAQAAPMEWAEFVKAASERSVKVRDDLVRAPAAVIQTAQGRAQESAAFAELLRDAVVTANRIAK